MAKPVLALYGNIAIPRCYCFKCRAWSLVIDGRTQCCNDLIAENPRRQKRMVEPKNKRKLPSLTERGEILKNQDNRCLYCGKRFGDIVFKDSKPKILRLEWDHALCFSYSQNNKFDNFVAACQICNRLKGNLVFDDLADAIQKIKEMRRKSRYE